MQKHVSDIKCWHVTARSGRGSRQATNLLLCFNKNVLIDEYKIHAPHRAVQRRPGGGPNHSNITVRNLEKEDVINIHGLMEFIKS